MIGSSASRGRFQPINSDDGDYSRITGHIEARGPIVEVEIRLHPSELERYRLEGHMPLPYRAMGIIDTGAEKTCIQPSTASHLQLEPVGHANLSTAGSLGKTAVYYLSLQLGPTLEHLPDPIPVHACAAPGLSGAELLIGLDVILRGELIIYGPDNRYEMILPRSTKPPS